MVAIGAVLHHAVSVGRFAADGPVFWLWAATGLDYPALLTRIIRLGEAYLPEWRMFEA